MKQARRKELKTNELSIYLHQVQEAIARYSSYIIGGVVAVVLVLVIGLYVQHNRHETQAANWRTYRELMKSTAEQPKPEDLTRTRSLVDETAGDPNLGPLAVELHADTAYQRAMSLSPLNSVPERKQMLETARDGYQKILDQFGSRADLAARARLGLAAVAETLYMDGNGDWKAAEDQYRKLEEGKGVFAQIARERRETLAQRTEKLRIVATRPAEPVATAPAPVAAVPASQPILTTPPGTPATTPAR